MSCEQIFDCLLAFRGLPKCNWKARSCHSHRPSRSKGCQSIRSPAPNRETSETMTTRHRWRCRERHNIDSLGRTASGTARAYFSIFHKGVPSMRHASYSSLLSRHLLSSHTTSTCGTEGLRQPRISRPHIRTGIATAQRREASSRTDAERSSVRIFEKSGQFFWGSQP